MGYLGGRETPAKYYAQAGGAMGQGIQDAFNNFMSVRDANTQRAMQQQMFQWQIEERQRAEEERNRAKAVGALTQKEWEAAKAKELPEWARQVKDYNPATGQDEPVYKTIEDLREAYGGSRNLFTTDEYVRLEEGKERIAKQRSQAAQGALYQRILGANQAGADGPDSFNRNQYLSHYFGEYGSDMTPDALLASRNLARTMETDQQADTTFGLGVRKTQQEIRKGAVAVDIAENFGYPEAEQRVQALKNTNSLHYLEKKLKTAEAAKAEQDAKDAGKVLWLNLDNASYSEWREGDEVRPELIDGQPPAGDWVPMEIAKLLIGQLKGAGGSGSGSGEFAHKPSDYRQQELDILREYIPPEYMDAFVTAVMRGDDATMYIPRGTRQRLAKMAAGEKGGPNELPPSPEEVIEAQKALFALESVTQSRREMLGAVEQPVRYLKD